ITDVPIWPGVTEYLYQAAALGFRCSGGTCMVPSGLTPRRRSTECTPMAGISTETGIERRSDSHHALPRGPRGWGSEPALWPGHDHTEPGYAPPRRVPQCRLLAFPRVFYPRSLK